MVNNHLDQPTGMVAAQLLDRQYLNGGQPHLGDPAAPISSSHRRRG
jgi:hypothetical protein